ARAGLGVEQAMSPRYTTFASLLWVVVVVLLEALGRSRSGDAEPSTGSVVIRGVSGLAIVIILALSLATSLHARPWARQQSKALRAARDAIRERRADDAVLLRLYPDAGVLRARLRVLEARRLSVFRDGG